MWEIAPKRSASIYFPQKCFPVNSLFLSETIALWPLVFWPARAAVRREVAANA